MPKKKKRRRPHQHKLTKEKFDALVKILRNRAKHTRAQKLTT